MTEIEDCIDWLLTYDEYLPKRFEHLGFGYSHKDLKNESVFWGFKPIDLMPEFLYDNFLLDEFKEYLKKETHAFYIRNFENFYSQLCWWDMFTHLTNKEDHE